MRDQVIRHAFHRTILKSAHDDADTFVVDELGLKNGEIRADIAVLNGTLVGYEIKTERDTLSRLNSQIVAYNEVFDKSFLIVSDNHLIQAIHTIPEWWGIYRIKKSTEGKYFFSCYRSARLNKTQNTYTLAQLLWKNEAIEVANMLLRKNTTRNLPKRELYDLISGICSKKKLSKIIIQYLKQRDNWRTDRLSLLKNDG